MGWLMHGDVPRSSLAAAAATFEATAGAKLETRPATDWQRCSVSAEAATPTEGGTAKPRIVRFGVFLPSSDRAISAAKCNLSNPEARTRLGALPRG